ncbi:MAG: hypothetical protein E6X72_22335 [Clostridioides difficile]|nr:hypothetical protein [Clostridioides difficile]MDU5207923.1 hypothetical protein [Clostridioides difficile]
MSNKMKQELLRFINSRKCSVEDFWSANGQILGYYNRRNEPVLGSFEDLEKEFIGFLSSNRRNFKVIAEHEIKDTKIKLILKVSATEKDKIKLSLEPYN